MAPRDLELGSWAPAVASEGRKINKIFTKSIVRNNEDVSTPAKLDSDGYREDFLRILINHYDPSNDNLKIYSKAFFGLLDYRLGQFLQTKVFKESASLMIKTEPSGEGDVREDLMPKLYQILGLMATEMGSGRTSIDAILRKVVEPPRLPSNEITLARLYQCIFKLISILTMLYTAADEPDLGKFQLVAPNSRTKARSRHRQNLTWPCLQNDISESSVEKDLDHLLANFGSPIIQRCYAPATRRDFYEDTIIASNLNYDTLHKIGHLDIEWVDTISLHLELDECSSKLKLFAFPSFCAMFYAASFSSPSFSQETFLSKLFSRQMMLGDGYSAISDANSYAYSVDFFVEILCSYRVIFGQHEDSAKKFKAIKPKEFQDPLLKTLCGLPCKSEDNKDFYSWLDVAHCKTMYSASSDFPLIGRRLLNLQEYMNTQNPSDLRTLWYDDRDVLRWYTFWAVVVVGGLSILSSWLSVILAAIQVYQGYTNA